MRNITVKIKNNIFTKEWKKYGFVPRNKQSIEQDFEKTINKQYDGIKLDKKKIEKKVM